MFVEPCFSDKSFMKTLGMEDKNWTEKEFKNYGEFCVKTSGRHGEYDKITVCPRFKFFGREEVKNYGNGDEIDFELA